MADTATRATPDGWSTSRELRHQIEEFLTLESFLLDEWRLLEWLALFADDGRYVVPATDHSNPDLARDLTIIQDDRFLLEQRVNSLLTRTAHAEYPHSRTRRLITNVRAVQRDDGKVDVYANFVVYRMRLENVDCYVGSYRHLLHTGGDFGFQFEERRTVIDLEALRPHGKVSIIL